MIKLKKKSCKFFFFLGSIISEVAAAHNCSNHKIQLVLWAICCAVWIQIDSNVKIKVFLSTNDFF